MTSSYGKNLISASPILLVLLLLVFHQSAAFFVKPSYNSRKMMMMMKMSKPESSPSLQEGTGLIDVTGDHRWQVHRQGVSRTEVCIEMRWITASTIVSLETCMNDVWCCILNDDHADRRPLHFHFYAQILRTSSSSLGLALMGTVALMIGRSQTASAAVPTMQGK